MGLPVHSIVSLTTYLVVDSPREATGVYYTPRCCGSEADTAPDRDLVERTVLSDLAEVWVRPSRQVEASLVGFDRAFEPCLAESCDRDADHSSDLGVLVIEVTKGVREADLRGHGVKMILDSGQIHVRVPTASVDQQMPIHEDEASPDEASAQHGHALLVFRVTFVTQDRAATRFESERQRTGEIDVEAEVERERLSIGPRPFHPKGCQASEPFDSEIVVVVEAGRGLSAQRRGAEVGCRVVADLEGVGIAGLAVADEFHAVAVDDGAVVVLQDLLVHGLALGALGVVLRTGDASAADVDNQGEGNESADGTHGTLLYQVVCLF